MNVIVWGCGTMGKRIFSALNDQYRMKIVAYTDSSESMWGRVIYNTPIIAPGEITQQEFDYILIAVYDFGAIRKICGRLTGLGIPEEKVKAIAIEPEFTEAFMDQRMYWIRDLAKYFYEEQRIGNVAECGVFRGDSAKFINMFFPDKKLYLFDTFEGFEKSDIEYEIKLEHSEYNTSKFTRKELFAGTSIELLMKKMKHPETIEIHKGYFPESAEGIEDVFCFVNLDMDLYLPMLNGLRFFWDKMVEGGCILMHDYFHPSLPGVKKALDDFEMERDLCIKKMSIGDGCSIALIK